MALTYSPFPLLLLFLLSSSCSASTASPSSNETSVVDSIKGIVSDASDTFTDFIYSFSDAFLVGIGSSDRPEDLDIDELLRSLGIKVDGTSTDAERKLLPEYLQEHWRDVLLYKIGFVVCVAVGILFVVFMPFVGLFFCCCRCCGNCGGKRSGKKHSSSKKVCCHFFLFLFTVVLVLFVMGSFIVAHQLNGNAKSVVRKEDNVVVKAASTVSPTIKNLFDGVADAVTETLDNVAKKGVELFLESGDEVAKGISELLRKIKLADHLEKARDLLTSFLNAGDDAEVILEKTERMKNTSIQSVIGPLIQTLKNCGKPQCATLETKILPLDADETLANVPTNMLREVSEVIEELRQKNFIEKLESISGDLSKIDGKFKAEMDKYKNVIGNVTNDLQREIEKHIERFRNDIDSKLPEFEKEAEKFVDGLDRIVALPVSIDQTFDYMMYAMYGVSAAAGLAVLCLLTAFLAGCCSPKTSADCFMAFTGFYFIFCPLLMLLTLVFYNSVGQVQVEGCNPLLHPDPTKTTLMDQAANQAIRTFKPNITVSLSKVLHDCSRGESLYNIVRSTGVVDKELDEILEMVNADKVLPQIEKQIEEKRGIIEKTFNDTIGALDVDGVTRPILEALDKAGLEDVFANVSSTVNVAGIKTELSGVNLTKVAEELRVAAKSMTAAGDTQTATDLEKAADDFEKLENDGSLEKEVFPLLDAIGAAVDGLLSKKSLDNETRSLISDLQSSISTLLSDLPSLVATALTDFTFAVSNLITNSINKFIRRLEGTEKDPIIACTPVWGIITAAVSIPCSLFVDPFNGYWFEIGGVVGVGFVAIILAVRIAGILRDEVRAEEEEDQVFDVRNNHVTNHHQLPQTKNQVGHDSPAHRGGGGGRRRNDDDAIEMRERNSYPPPYAAEEGTYRSTDNIYADYRNGKPYSYQDGHVNNGYRF